MSTVAVDPVPEFVFVQVRSVRVQPLVAVSVTDLLPSWLPSNVNTFVFESVPSASSSSEKPDVPEPLVVNAKSCASFGCASLTIVSLPSCLLVNVQTQESPGWTLMVALLCGAWLPF